MSTTQEQLIAVGRALLPYLRNDLTDIELGRAAHDAAAAVNATAICPHCGRKLILKRELGA